MLRVQVPFPALFSAYLPVNHFSYRKPSETREYVRARAAPHRTPAELDRVLQTLTGRIRELAERYAGPLPTIVDEVATLSARVEGHLRKMGFRA
jgi:hypothetical protein